MKNAGGCEKEGGRTFFGGSAGNFSVLRNESTVPRRGRRVSLNGCLVPRHGRGVPLNESAVPLNDAGVPLHESAGPLHEDAVPLNERPIPSSGWAWSTASDRKGDPGGDRWGNTSRSKTSCVGIRPRPGIRPRVKN